MANTAARFSRAMREVWGPWWPRRKNVLSALNAMGRWADDVQWEWPRGAR